MQSNVTLILLLLVLALIISSYEVNRPDTEEKRIDQ